MATSLTARDILTMTSEDLRKYVSDLGQDPKNMIETDMQTWLLEKVPPSEAASAVETPTTPSFLSKLSPEMQLQYYLKKEEQEREFELTKLKIEAEERDKAREAEERERERDKDREAELDRMKLDFEAKLELKRLELSQAQNGLIVQCFKR